MGLTSTPALLRLDADAPTARAHEPRRPRRAVLGRPSRVREHGPVLRLLPGECRPYASVVVRVLIFDG